ncbi:D-arabinose 1-dehydrogenase-like Zn-dependent alcohol dehydrogenase [Cryobacterium sp. CAN_C3]|uniref:alcohol dehydrogenase catalytic domain-containing protein n=1 Tax=unclassified Cryobacterium TaxID=2649013 RepID=UPI001A30A8C9|nr:D-arabinose 1-dehydrogenase-like Zn-dependent alcohol dehydrogenase [Cryobacterium sp. CAN_C3]
MDVLITLTVPALATPATNQPLVRTQIGLRTPGANDVAIDIEFAGVCHSDIHQARDEWGVGLFPVAPGHEIAGIVSAVGSDVTRYRVGDRVDVGVGVGIPTEPDEIKMFWLASQRRSIAGSKIGGIRQT